MGMENSVTEDVPSLLIGGPGRSGTNVVKDVFRSHPLVFGLPFEARFTIDPDGLAPTLRLLRSSWSPFVAERALRRLDGLLSRVARRAFSDRAAAAWEHMMGKMGRDFTRRAYREWEVAKVFPDFLEHKDQLIRELTLLEYVGEWPGAPGGLGGKKRVVSQHDEKGFVVEPMRRFLRSLYSGALTRANKEYYVDDNTFNILFAQELLDLLPRGRIMHVVRDPRDVVASYLHQRWTPHNLTAASRYYLSIMERWFAVRKTVSQDRILEVRLEDLCDEPEVVLRQISDWTELPFDRSLLDVPLNKSNAGRWKRDLSVSDQAQLAQVLEPIVRSYGYDA